MKSIAGSTNAAILALVVARSSRAVTAFQPGSGRLFSSRAAATTAGRGMYGLATAATSTVAAVVGGSSSRCVYVLLGADHPRVCGEGGEGGCGVEMLRELAKVVSQSNSLLYRMRYRLTR